MIPKEEFDKIFCALGHIKTQFEQEKITSSLPIDLPISRYFDPGSGLKLLLRQIKDKHYCFIPNNTEFSIFSATRETIASQLFVEYVLPSSIKNKLNELLKYILNEDGTFKEDKEDVFRSDLESFLNNTRAELEKGFKDFSLSDLKLLDSRLGPKDQTSSAPTYSELKLSEPKFSDPDLMAEYFLKAMLMTYVVPSKFFSCTVKKIFKETLDKVLEETHSPTVDKKLGDLETLSFASAASLTSVATTSFFSRATTSFSSGPERRSILGRRFPTIRREPSKGEEQVTEKLKLDQPDTLTRPVPNLSFFISKPQAPASAYLPRPNTN